MESCKIKKINKYTLLFQYFLSLPDAFASFWEWYWSCWTSSCRCWCATQGTPEGEYVKALTVGIGQLFTDNFDLTVLFFSGTLFSSSSSLSSSLAASSWTFSRHATAPSLTVQSPVATKNLRKWQVLTVAHKLITDWYSYCV